MKKLTPAEVVIKELGIRPLARALGCDPSTIAAWKSRGGTVPHKWQEKIIHLAEGRITAHDLVFGR